MGENIWNSFLLLRVHCLLYMSQLFYWRACCRGLVVRPAFFVPTRPNSHSGLSTRHISSSSSPSSSSSMQQQHHNQQQRERPLVVVLAGPTAVGKSDVAARICAHRRGVILSADSVQAYQGLQIGANQPSALELEQTPHLFVSIIDNPSKTYNAAEWTSDVLDAIQEFTLNHAEEATTDHQSALDSAIQQARYRVEQKETNQQQLQQHDSDDNDRELATIPSHPQPIVPVVVGGTMMYLQWLVHGRPQDSLQPTPAAIQRAKQEILAFENADDWESAVQHVVAMGEPYKERVTTKLCGKDWYRLRRILEVAYTVEEQNGSRSNSSISDKEAILESLYSGERHKSLAEQGYDVRCIFLCPSDRMKHTVIVDQRCEQMLLRGLLTETADLEISGKMPEMASRAIGYRQTLQYLKREAPKEHDVDAFVAYLEEFTAATRRYAKKQMQWFRRDSEFMFVPVDVTVEKEHRIQLASDEVERLLGLSRSDYDIELGSESSTSAHARQINEEQGKKMKIYQYRRHILKDGSPELEVVLEESDQCTNRLQAKRIRSVADSTS